MNARLTQHLRFVVIGAVAFLPVAGAAEPESPPPKPAAIKVTGTGWWKNRELRRTLALLEPEQEKLAELDAAFIEDAVVVLQSSLEREGFLQPSGTVILRHEGHDLGEFPWKPREVPNLPRDIMADAAEFQLEPGVRYFFGSLAFEGLEVIDEATARSYFIEEGMLFGGGSARRFTPTGLRGGVANLQQQLIQQGYIDARVQVRSEQRDDETGRVDVMIAAEVGRLHRVRTVAPPVAAPDGAAEELRQLAAGAAGRVYSPLWQQDFLQAARRVLYREGYAEAQVRLEPAADAAAPEPNTDAIAHDFRLQVAPGAQFHVGEVRFSGAERTSRSVLRRAIVTEPGDLFNRSSIEDDRARIAGLGAFDAVRIATVPATSPEVLDLEFQLRPARQLEASVLAGYGSYEQLRGGVEVSHLNLFGRAHRGRLQLIYSLKSAYGDYYYTVPQIFGTTTDATARVFGLEREEVSFDRKEYGTSLGFRRRIHWLGADASLRYQFESVRADNVSPDVRDTVPTDSTVAALTFDLTRDRLDNPVTPRRGYLLALSLETATRALGGEVDYQRLDLRASWHRRVGREKYLHLGVRHGVVWTLGGSASDDIPFAKRYFPGGEGTVRGFREGRAAPRGSDGTVIGAEVSTVLNIEFEQGVAQNLAAVAFIDAGFTAASLDDYPGDQTRVSLGVGLRYNTPIGPARLEYGHNIVRETGDAIGELHFALGFPF